MNVETNNKSDKYLSRLLFYATINHYLQDFMCGKKIIEVCGEHCVVVWMHQSLLH